MKRLIILMVLMSILVACGSTKDTEKEEPDEPVVDEKEEEKDEEKEKPKEKDEEKKEQEGQEESKEEPKEEPKEETEDKPVHKDNNKTDDDKQATNDNTDKKTDKKPDKKSEEKPEKAPEVKNEKVEVAAENIIQAQNNIDYATLKGYLGQNITLNEKNNTLKITNVDYPHEAELLSDIKTENIEHRFTQESGKDHIVGFAVTDYETELSYTIDFTMRVGKDSWKMLNMQINK